MISWNKVKTLPLHVFCMAVFPALALMANNLGQTAYWVVQRPLLVSIILGMLTFLLAWLITRDGQKAGVLASWFLILFFSYGHVYAVVEDFELFGFLIGRHRYLAMVWGAALLIGGWLIVRRNRAFDELTVILNLVSLVLVVFQIGRFIVFEFQSNLSYKQAQASITDSFLTPQDPDRLPDIYLIILDMYGREDALVEYYEYDNRPFLSQLEALGFYVADCARSNYSNTALSLASQLNMDYVDNLLGDVNLESTSYLLRYSGVRQALEEIGYTTIAFNTGADWANLDDAQFFYDRPPLEHVVTALEPFEMMFVQGTFAGLFQDVYISQNLEAFQWVETPVEAKAQRTRTVLERLPLIPSMAGPKFVHAHIMIPHPPYIFNADGSVNLQAEQVEDNVGMPIQLNYLNPQILEIVEKIVKSSTPEPIVILEGDHGFGNHTRTSILFAVHTPDGGASAFYARISLVNSFRIIFDRYFGVDLPLLEDRSYKHVEGDLFEYYPQDEWNPACKP